MTDDVDIEDGTGGYRHVSGSCAICFCTYQKNDCVTWSSNRACRHVFHENCILNWLQTSGSKSLSHRIRHRVGENNSHSRSEQQQQCVELPPREEILKEEIKHVSWLCPICRQDFIRIPEDNHCLPISSISNDGEKMHHLLYQTDAQV